MKGEIDAVTTAADAAIPSGAYPRAATRSMPAAMEYTSEYYKNAYYAELATPVKCQRTQY